MSADLVPFGVVACKCGRGAHPTNPDICAAGHTLKGKPGPALNTGQRSAIAQAATEAVRSEISAAVLRDAGYTEQDAPEALRRVADGLAQSVLVRDSAFARVAEAGGPLTSSDRARRAFDVWLRTAQAVERMARTIGLRRVPKSADVAPLDWMKGKDA